MIIPAVCAENLFRGQDCCDIQKNKKQTLREIKKIIFSNLLKKDFGGKQNGKRQTSYELGLYRSRRPW